MRIGQPALWLFDCRCSGSSSLRSAWDIADYAKAMMQMRSWMRDVPWYNAVFMLPQSYTYHEVVQHLALSENAIHQRGVWAFENPTQEKGPVLMHEGQIEGMYEAFADLVIVYVQPLGSSHSENLGPRRGDYSQQCIYWKNNATSWRAPVSRPSHNLSGNGRAATSRDTGMTNRDLGASRGSDERLRAGRARRSHLSHEVTCELTWSCESRRRT